MNLDEITIKFAAELSDFEKTHGYINGGFATGLLRKYATESYNQAVRDAAESVEVITCDIDGSDTCDIDRQSILKLLK